MAPLGGDSDVGPTQGGLAEFPRFGNLFSRDDQLIEIATSEFFWGESKNLAEGGIGSQYSSIDMQNNDSLRCRVDKYVSTGGL